MKLWLVGIDSLDRMEWDSFDVVVAETAEEATRIADEYDGHPQAWHRKVVEYPMDSASHVLEYQPPSGDWGSQLE